MTAHRHPLDPQGLAALIAAQNDLVRRSLLLHGTTRSLEDATGLSGALVLSHGLQDLDPLLLLRARILAARTASFPLHDDPRQEHDFGSLTLPDPQGRPVTILWKIDLLPRDEDEPGAPPRDGATDGPHEPRSPHIPHATTRTLTLLTPDEW